MFPVCVCTSYFPFYKDTGHIGLGVQPTPVWLHFKLTGYICSGPLSKQGHIRRLDGQLMNCQGRGQPKPTHNNIPQCMTKWNCVLFNYIYIKILKNKLFFSEQKKNYVFYKTPTAPFPKYIYRQNPSLEHGDKDKCNSITKSAIR